MHCIALNLGLTGPGTDREKFVESFDLGGKLFVNDVFGLFDGVLLEGRHLLIRFVTFRRVHRGCQSKCETGRRRKGGGGRRRLSKAGLQRPAEDHRTNERCRGMDRRKASGL